MNRMTQPHHAHESLDGHTNIQTYTCALIQISLLPQEGVGLLPSCLPLNSQDSSSAPMVKAKPWLEEEGGICWERKGRGNTGNRRSTTELQKKTQCSEIISSSWTDVPRALQGAECQTKENLIKNDCLILHFL